MRKAVGNGLLGSGTVGLTASGASAGIVEWLPIATSALPYVVPTSLILIASGVGVHCYRYADKSSIPEVDVDDRFSITKATSSDLRDIDRLSSRAFGSAASNYQQIKLLFRKSRYIFWKIRTKGPEPKVVGYFCLFSLTKAGEDALHEGVFSGQCPHLSHIKGRANLHDAVYVGAVYGASFRAKAWALACMRQRLRFLEPPTIYAKAATKDGLRLLKAEGFNPIAGMPSEIGSFFAKDTRDETA